MVTGRRGDMMSESDEEEERMWARETWRGVATASVGDEGFCAMVVCMMMMMMMMMQVWSSARK